MEALPSSFIVTRYGIECGLTPDEIVAAKEQARLASGGVFYWAVGHNVARAVGAMREAGDVEPLVVFSPLIGDGSNAEGLAVRWTRGIGLDGVEREIPPEQIVTSPKRKRRYALVCRSDVPLALRAVERGIDVRRLRQYDTTRNGASGKQVTTQRTTAAVDRGDSDGEGVAMTARLVDVVELRGPVPFLNPFSSQ